MKPIVRRMWGKLILLAVCTCLSACCGVKCNLNPSNAATSVNPSVESSTTPPIGSHGSYPLFEGDYFTITLPTLPHDSPPAWEEPVISPGEPRRHTSSGEGLLRLMDSTGRNDPILVHSRVLDSVLEDLGEELSPTETSEESDTTNRMEVDPAILADIKLGIAMRAAEEAVLHMGFFDHTGGDVLTKEFFEVEPHLMTTGGDILKVARINCEMQRQSDSSFCDLDPGQQELLIKRVTGVDATEYGDRKLNRYFFYQRPQHRKWPPDPGPNEGEYITDPISLDKDINVFIEHSVISATTHPSNPVASIRGRVFSSYKVTNEPKLSTARALKIAHRKLWRIPGVSKYDYQPSTEEALPLVLLPYGHTWRFNWQRLNESKWPLYRTPELRYAYRTTLWGNYVDKAERRVEGASWRAWVDAESGDILQLFPQFAFQGTVMAEGEQWKIAPPDQPIRSKFRIDNDADGKFCLKLNRVFAAPKYSDGSFGKPLLEVFCREDPNFAEDPDFAKGLECRPDEDSSYCICKQAVKEPFAYMHMNAYSHVDRYQRVLDAALCGPLDSTITPDCPADSPYQQIGTTNIAACQCGQFRAAKNSTEGDYVPMRIGITNGNSSGSYATENYHLVLGEVGSEFSMDGCSEDVSANASLRPGAQDATVIIHEFSHIVTDGLMSSRNDDWCHTSNELGEPDEPDESACPVPHSLDLVHDLADGLAAIQTGTNWFGVWYSNNDRDKNNSETNGTPRELNHEVDRFPNHRVWEELPGAPRRIRFGHKEYADGQIAGAALWAVAENMDNWIPVYGRSDFQTSLLNVLPGFRFLPDVCKFRKGRICDYPDKCDIDVYRLLHRLLKNLLDNLDEAGIKVPPSKVISGFAKTGIFVVPPQCLMADPEARDSYCDGGGEKYGGDAIIEINDNWLNHSLDPDTSEPIQPPPSFDVWTGPKFQFDRRNHAFEAPPLERPCNKFYKVAITNNCKFRQDPPSQDPPVNLMKETEYIQVDEHCRGKWSPDDDFWEKLVAASQRRGGSNLYYRVITSPTEYEKEDTTISSSEYPGFPMEAKDVNERVEPNRINPPFAIFNSTGEVFPDEISSSCD